MGFYFRLTTGSISAAAACILFLVPAVGASGSWTFREEGNEKIVFSQGGQEIFQVGCSKYFGFSAIYPDQSRKGHHARIELSNSKTKLNFVGRLYRDPDDASKTLINVLLDVKSPEPVHQLVSMIGSGLPITVSAGKSTYVISGSNLANLESRFDESCS
jgi:hypothetical protein